MSIRIITYNAGNIKFFLYSCPNTQYQILFSILDYVNRHFDENHTIPSVREISDGTGIAVTTVQRYLCAMKESGELAAGVGTSRETVRRYIRLTYLEKALLDLVDEGRIALTPAVELSYLPEEVQWEIAEVYRSDEITPSYSQSVRLRKLYEDGKLTENGLYEILSITVELVRAAIMFVPIP